MTQALLTKKRTLYALAFVFIFSVLSCSHPDQTTSAAVKEEPVQQQTAVAAPPAVVNDSVAKQEEAIAAPSPVPVANDTVQQQEELKKEDQIYTGNATYYSDDHQGKLTANKEVYDKNLYTAAVRLNTVPLPYGTMIEVTSVKRNKKVRVKVNDIMSDKNAIIDLSYIAAKEIGLDIDGRTKVTIRVIPESER